MSLGMGCAPSGLTIPSISHIGTPLVGGPVGVDVSSPSTPDGIALVVYGFSSMFDPIFNVPLPLDLGPFGFSGCTLLASTEFSVALVLDGNGEATQSFPVPPLIKWCEREIAFQSFGLEGSDLLSSNGLQQIIGS